MASLELLAALLRLVAQGFATTAAATGLLYLLRAHVPAGPLPVPDVLPLDELPNHAAASIVLLTIVWISIAAAVLLLSSSRRRPLQPLGFGLATFCTSFASCAGSLQIVRQTTTLDALTATATLPAVYLEGMLAAVGAILTSKLVAAHPRLQGRMEAHR